jgi:hypothetical protein
MLLNMVQCRTPELQHFDVLLFSLLFSGSVAFTHAHAVALFLLFYSSFWIMEMNKDDYACSS